MSSTAKPSSPSQYRTVYDETFRSKSYPSLSIASMANSPNLVGKLEHHAPTTDGSFSICIADGLGVFVSKALYDSIPEQHRPALNTSGAGQQVSNLTPTPMTTIGSTLMPLILTNARTGEKFRVVLYAHVLPNLFMGMFIGGKSGVVWATQYIDGECMHGFMFGGNPNELTMVKGI